MAYTTDLLRTISVFVKGLSGEPGEPGEAGLRGSAAGLPGSLVGEADMV